MAVNIWVYGNAKIQGDRGDYFVRACGQAFLPYKDRMIRLSNRLLAVERRRGEAQDCRAGSPVIWMSRRNFMWWLWPVSRKAF